MYQFLAPVRGSPGAVSGQAGLSSSGGEGGGEEALSEHEASLCINMTQFKLQTLKCSSEQPHSVTAVGI